MVPSRSALRGQKCCHRDRPRSPPPWQLYAALPWYCCLRRRGRSWCNGGGNSSFTIACLWGPTVSRQPLTQFLSLILWAFPAARPATRVEDSSYMGGWCSSCSPHLFARFPPAASQMKSRCPRSRVALATAERRTADKACLRRPQVVTMRRRITCPRRAQT